MKLLTRISHWWRTRRFKRDRIIIRESRSHFPRMADERCSMTRFRLENHRGS